MKARILFYLAAAAALVLVALPVGVVVGGAVVYVPDDYPTIQQAVDNAAAGDTIVVRDGTYQENVAVNKALTIQSENGTANCVVSAANPDEHVFEVSADGVSITGLMVENAAGVNSAGKEAAGVYLGAAEHCTISGNDVTGNNLGIWLEDSCSNTLTDNNVHDNVYGIVVDSFSNNNVLMNNAATNNGDSGFVVASSSGNTFTNNTATDNSNYGIYLVDSSNNNTLYNNYFNNTNNAYDDGTNTWNTARTEGANIIGGPYLGGNCWSDYAGADTNGDGLGDTLVPYAEGIPHCGDYLPLVLPAVTPAGAGSAGVPTAGITYKAGTGSADATIAGTTYEANANLMAGASIVLELDGEAVASTTSDANGGYSFTVGGVGNYTVTVTKDGFTSQSKWVDVTALEQGYTVYFKGMDASYPTAPSGSYVTKCSNLWLCGASYSQGFALEASRVFDVLYAWVHPS